MNDSISWMKIVLRNIYRMYEEGCSFSNTPWDFAVKKSSTPEQIRNECWEQQKALQKLQHAGAIKIKISENDMRQQQLEGLRKGIDIYGWELDDNEINSMPGIEGIKHYDRLIDLTGFSYDRFNTYCKELDFDPSSDKAKATLSFESRDLYITAEGQRYKLGRLNYGRPSIILEYCLNKKPGQEVAIETLKQKNKSITNIKQALKDSVLNVDGPIAPFVSASPVAIVIHPTRLLSHQELDRLKNLAED